MGDAKKLPRRQIPIVERHAKWLDDYIKGATFREVAEKHGVAVSTVHTAVHHQLAQARKRRDDLADVALENQLARLEWLYSQACEAIAEARDGRELGVAQLLSSARGILDSRAKLLGLDQGVTVTVLGESMMDRELAELTERMSQIIDAEAVELPPGADGD